MKNLNSSHTYSANQEPRFHVFIGPYPKGSHSILDGVRFLVVLGITMALWRPYKGDENEVYFRIVTPAEAGVQGTW